MSKTSEQRKNPHMTEARFTYWHGFENLTVKQLLELILELANKRYSIDEFIKDVKEYEA